MKWIVLVSLCVLVSCAGNPTAPTSVAPTDPLFNAVFMSTFAPPVLFRPSYQTVFVGDVDDKGNKVPSETIAQALAAVATLQQSLGLPVDVRPVTGVAPVDTFRGVSVRWLWSDVWTPDGPRLGGYGTLGQAFIYYRAATFEVCGGLMSTVIRHEVLHALGFEHTDDPNELMFPESRYCDTLPSARERFHIRLALGVK